MRGTATVILTLVLLGGAGAGQPDMAKKELAKYQGSWRLVAIELNGNPNELAPNNQAKFFLKEDKVLIDLKQGGLKELATLKLDPTVKPTLVDVHFKDGTTIWEGIYKMEGDKVTLCLNTQTQGTRERPLVFSTKDNPGLMIFIFQQDSK